VGEIESKNCSKMSGLVIADTKYGKIRGIPKISALGTSYIAFLGIRYAVPPLRELRFKVRKN
jgi:carboxylesterase type B